MADWEDRLIETMLEEKVGGDTPPDLRDAIRQKMQNRSRRRIVLTILTTAAAVALLLLVAYQKPEEHIERIPVNSADPVQQFRIEGEYQLVNKQIVTGRKSALLYMGRDEYIKVLIGPDSIVHIDGDELLLLNGFVDCEVKKDCGGFKVHTDVGIAEVLGTRFVVHVLKKENEMIGRRMLVNVLAGAVFVSAVTGNMSNYTNAGEVAVVNKMGLVAAEKKDEKTLTPKQIEMAAINSLKDTFRAKATRMREEMLQDPDIAKLLAVATKATNTYFAKLEANPVYKQLQNEKKEIDEQRRTINWREMDRDARRAAYKEMGDSYRRQMEISRELKELGETDPELKPLRKAMQNGWVTYQNTLDEKLNKSKEYAALQAKIIEIGKWQKSLMVANYSQYSHRGGGRRPMPTVLKRPQKADPVAGNAAGREGATKKPGRETETF